MINFVVQNDWKWNHCRLPIKRSEKHCKKKEEEYFYQVISSDDTGPINEQKIKIGLDRPFPFEPDTGFVWHKSWNLPQISIAINEVELQVLKQQYKQIKCQIMSVYPIKHSNSYYLHQISVEGNCHKTIHENPTVFKFLKFGQTSFNHNRSKFCLLLWVYGENTYKDKDDLYCLISSPIYVDSRKEARKKEAQPSSNSAMHTPNKFISPIRGIKGSISNSSEGFISYYGAQNIRNKIKHPFYIAYHFDKIFKLYMNGECELQCSQILPQLQASRYTETLSSSENLVFLQLSEPSEKNRKKIISIIEKWKFGLMEISYSGNQQNNTAKWVQISKEQIRQAYKAYYEAEMMKQQEIMNKKQQIIDNIQGQNQVRSSSKIIEPKVPQASDQKSIQQERPRTYQLRTVIDLSRPRKRVKVQQQHQQKQHQQQQQQMQ